MLVLAIVGANLPFLTERVFVVGPRLAPKPFALRLLEVLVFGALAFGIGMVLEQRIGQRQPQGWEFYAIALCLLLTFAFPGFVWRYLRRQ